MADADLSDDPETGPDSEPDEGSGSLRRCVVSRRVLPPEELLRFVADPAGTLVPDIRRKLPGRGAWTALSRSAVEAAVRTRAFSRGLKRQVDVPPGLAEQVDALLARDCLQAIAMANKAGLLTSGFAKVEAAIEAGRCAALIAARDGAEDGRRKLLQAVRRRPETTAATPVIDCFESRDLELALGRELVIHACLLQGAATEACLGRWRRLMTFRTSPVPAADAGPGQAAETGSVAPRIDPA